MYHGQVLTAHSISPCAQMLGISLCWTARDCLGPLSPPANSTKPLHSHCAHLDWQLVCSDRPVNRRLGGEAWASNVTIQGCPAGKAPADPAGEPLEVAQAPANEAGQVIYVVVICLAEALGRAALGQGGRGEEGGQRKEGAAT